MAIRLSKKLTPLSLGAEYFWGKNGRIMITITYTQTMNRFTGESAISR
jgi:hypothetical protein